MSKKKRKLESSWKRRPSRPQPLETIKAAVSPKEIKAAMSPAGGFTAKTLHEWGVLWPPTAGWRKQLVRNWQNQQVPRNEDLQRNLDRKAMDGLHPSTFFD